jgi:hypothetical protein
MQNERQANTLQTTALVHEAYVRLVDVTQVGWHEPAVFSHGSANDARILASEGGRVVLFRRADEGGNRRGFENLGENGAARLGSREGLVAAN